MTDREALIAGPAWARVSQTTAALPVRPAARDASKLLDRTGRFPNSGCPMGKHDNRTSMKMRRRKAQRKLKARRKRQKVEKKPASAGAAKPAKKSRPAPAPAPAKE
jgi:hypothetical protein